VRVIAGRLRGRSLKAPPGDATRPTGARVKEALFSILGDVTGYKVLDLYAGSGALGIEALSRGAAFALFVESARPALACLRENLTKLDLSEASKVVSARVELVKGQLPAFGPFDLVLCDPPWKDAELALEALEGLAGLGIFSPAVQVVLEHAAKDKLAPGGAEGALVVADQRRWGDTAITLMGLAGGKSEPADVPVPPPS
jgi:16S rRNA (guanine966-N2)-methyltransferase